MRRSLSWICVSAFALATRVAAQQVQGSMTIAGGTATDIAGTTSRALTVAPALTFTPDSHALFGIGATGTEYGDRRWSLGGQASAAVRLPMGSHLAVTANADGGATGTSYDFSYTRANALPAIEAVAGPLTGYAGVSAAMASTRVSRTTPGAPDWFGLGPATPGSSTTVTNSRTSHGVVVGGNLRLAGEGDESLVVGVRQHHAIVDTTTTIDRSASLSASGGRVSLTGTLGLRAEPGTHTTFGSATAMWAIDPRLAIEVAGGSYPADRLVGTSGGRFLTLGLSVITGRSATPAPMPSAVPAVAADLTRLSIRATDAHRVEVAGDFSNWKPIAAIRAPNGVWFADLRIPPGQYRYAFRIDDAAWAVPDGAATVDDGFGGKSAWLTVDPPNRSAR
jgi:hypothetical protein